MTYSVFFHIQNKCEQYWPERMHETKAYHRISVTMTAEEYYADYVDRQFIVQDDRKVSRSEYARVCI